MSIEDQFLAKLSRGYDLSPDEFDQMSGDLPPECIAAALVQRYHYTEEVRVLVEAARLYSHAGYHYEALEICSRFPRIREMHNIVQKTLPLLRKEYPDIPRIGKLLDQAFIVIDLNTGKMDRFPPVLPATVLKD